MSFKKVKIQKGKYLHIIQIYIFFSVGNILSLDTLKIVFQLTCYILLSYMVNYLEKYLFKIINVLIIGISITAKNSDMIHLVNIP